MQSIWPALITFLGVFTFAIVSPGPNFILVTNTTLAESRRAGLLTAFGVATGSGLFALAGLAGLLLLIHSLPYFAQGLRFAGGGYLVWIGFDMLRGCRRTLHLDVVRIGGPGRAAFHSYRTGLITNLTNPKAWAFYLSLFTMVMVPGFPLWSKLFLGISMFLISLAWYATVVMLISNRRFQPVFLGWRPLIQGVLGGMLMLIGARLLLS